MDREPVLFAQKKENRPATAQLLFPADKILSVTSGDGLQTFEQDRDYVWNPGSRMLTLTPNSRISAKTLTALYPAKGSPGSYGETIDGKTGLFFAEGGRVFQKLQVNVTYQHRVRWKGYTARPASSQLSRTITMLKNKQSLKIVVLGDSISYGFCASDMFHGPPFQPPYVGLVAEGLEVEYGVQIDLVNLSVGGTTSKWGVVQAPRVAAQHADLVVLAFGMNDASARISGPAYSENIRTIIDQVRKSNPNTDFILIATMTGNPKWIKADYVLYKQYRHELMRLVGPGIAVADLTSMWRDMLKVKRFTDITGNGINHPNDFGYRVYAQVILALLK